MEVVEEVEMRCRLGIWEERKREEQVSHHGERIDESVLTFRRSLDEVVKS